MNIEEILATIDKPTKAIIQTMTEVKLNKKHRDTKEPNKFGTVYKLQETLVEINSDYQELVNNQRIKENKDASFESSSLKWGECLDNKIVTKGDTKYLKVIEINKLSTPNYVTLNAETNTFDDTIEYDDLQGYLPPISTNTNQNLDNEIKVRMYKFDSIMDIHLQQ